jgi:hypothetical protein
MHDWYLKAVEHDRQQFGPVSACPRARRDGSNAVPSSDAAWRTSAPAANQIWSAGYRPARRPVVLRRRACLAVRATRHFGYEGEAGRDRSQGGRAD